MPDIYQIVSALVDKEVFTANDYSELMGSTFRPRQIDVLMALVEKGILQEEEYSDLLTAPADDLYEKLKSKGILE